MLITAVAATGLTIYFLYHAALREVSARLSEMAFIRAKFIDSIAREKENTHPKNSLEWFQAVVGQVAEAHRLYTETGSAADLVVATIREGNIIWISRGNTADLPATTPLTSRLAEPMRRALAGQSGVMEAPDYRNERVLAAYMPALDGNLGVVAKMDMAQVRAPFIRAASLALGLMLAVAAAGALVFLFLVGPILRRIERDGARIRQEKSKFESLLEAIPLGVVWIDRRGAWRFVNKRFTDITGYAPDEIGAGDNWFHMAFPDDIRRHEVAAYWSDELKTRRSGDISRRTFMIRCKYGSEKWIHFRPLAIADGDHLVTLEDITDHKKAEDEISILNRNLENRVAERTGDLKTTVASLENEVEERKRVEQSLRNSEARLAESNQIMAGILAHTHMMAVYLDAGFNFIWVNHAYAATTGRDPAFFIGKNHFELFPHQENQTIFQKVVDTGQPYIVSARPFSFSEQPESKITYWDYSLIPIMDHEGRTMGLVFTLAEVTDRVRTEEELRAKTTTLNTIFKNAPYMMMLVDEQGRVVDVNQAGENFTGKDRNAIIGSLGGDVFQLRQFI